MGTDSAVGSQNVSLQLDVRLVAPGQEQPIVGFALQHPLSRTSMQATQHIQNADNLVGFSPRKPIPDMPHLPPPEQKQPATAAEVEAAELSKAMEQQVAQMLNRGLFFDESESEDGESNAVLPQQVPEDTETPSDDELDALRDPEAVPKSSNKSNPCYVRGRECARQLKEVQLNFMCSASDCYFQA